MGITIVCLLAEIIETESGLKIEVVSRPEECERKVKKGDNLAMHYTGMLEDGDKFDSSRRLGKPLDFQIGIGKVIKGWDEGILGMCVGEKRKLVIPAELGYGKRGTQNIPPNSTLYFDIELMDVSDGPQKKNVFRAIDAKGDREISKDELKEYLVKQVSEVNLDKDEEELQDLISQQDKILKGIFIGDDKDKDGFISHSEFSGPKDEL